MQRRLISSTLQYCAPEAIVPKSKPDTAISRDGARPGNPFKRLSEMTFLATVVRCLGGNETTLPRPPREGVPGIAEILHFYSRPNGERFRPCHVELNRVLSLELTLLVCTRESKKKTILDWDYYTCVQKRYLNHTSYRQGQSGA